MENILEKKEEVVDPTKKPTPPVQEGVPKKVAPAPPPTASTKAKVVAPTPAFLEPAEPDKSFAKKLGKSIVFGLIGIAVVVAIVGAYLMFKEAAMPKEKTGDAVLEEIVIDTTTEKPKSGATSLDTLENQLDDTEKVLNRLESDFDFENNLDLEGAAF